MIRTPAALLAGFLLAGTFVTLGADLDAINVTVNDTNPDPGDLVTVRWTAISYNDEFVGSSNQGVMWSTDNVITRGDTLLEREPLGPLGGLFLPESSPETRVVTIPSNAVIGRTYYIGVYADYDLERAESNENNNGSNAVAVTIRGPDLDAIDLTINDTNPDLGDLVTVKWTAVSYGDIPASSTDQGVMLSFDNVIQSSDTILEREPLGPLGGVFLASSPETRVITIPDYLNPGQTYYIGVWADIDNAQPETNETNNGSNAAAFTPRGPDLRAHSLSVSSSTSGPTTSITAWPGQNLKLSWTALNSGDGATALFDFSQQGVRWSSDSTVTRSDPILEREPLGILVAGDDSPELRTVKVPANVIPGQTYYLAVEADTDREFREWNEDNNFSNVVSVTIMLPASAAPLDLADFNDLPYLEGEGLEPDDPRLQDNTGDGDADAGVTMNRSRCFAPGDTAYVNVTVALDPEYTTLFNGTEPTRLTAYHNTTPSQAGWQSLGSVTINAGEDGDRLNIEWDLPNTPGDHYVYGIVESQVDGQWYEVWRGWLDDEDPVDGVPDAPVMVRDSLPVVIVHGWSDVHGETFDNLEVMIETLWERPVRFFQYETDKFPLGDGLTGTGNGPRVDGGYTEIITGETKPSLAQQMAEFLADPEGPGASSQVTRADVIAHSMGGLVARNYALRSDSVMRRLVTMGTPSYGGLFADTTGALLNNQAEDLEFGCAVSWKLHREWKRRLADLPFVLTIIGTNDLAFGQYNQSDIVVTCNSASLEPFGFQEYYVPHPHTDSGPIGRSGLARIDDTTHPSWAPLEDFLMSDDGKLADNLPGHRAGADNVGRASHPDPLRNGALYILKQNQNGNPVPVTSVNLGHSPSGLPISSSGIHESGIYFATLVGADNSQSGGEFFTTASSTVFVNGSSEGGFSITVKAGETTVLAIDGDNNVVAEHDLDGDLLPNFIEELLINADPDDSLERHSDVDANGDYDRDGLSEVFEAALGTSPLIADVDPFSTGIENGFYYLRHHESNAEQGLEIVAQRSSNLDHWQEDGITETVLSITPTGRNKEWKIPIDARHRFLRLEVRREGSGP